MPLRAGPPGRGARSARGREAWSAFFPWPKTCSRPAILQWFYFGKTLKTCSLSKLVNMHVYHLHTACSITMPDFTL